MASAGPASQRLVPPAGEAGQLPRLSQGGKVCPHEPRYHPISVLDHPPSRQADAG